MIGSITEASLSWCFHSTMNFRGSAASMMTWGRSRVSDFNIDSGVNGMVNALLVNVLYLRKIGICSYYTTYA